MDKNEAKKTAWNYFDEQVKKGYFQKYDNKGERVYYDEHLFDWAVSFFGPENVIKIIKTHQVTSKNSWCTEEDLQYVYWYMDWRGEPR